MLRNRLHKPVSSRRKSPETSRRLGIENLEDRRVLSADPGWALSFGSPNNSASASQTVVDAAGNAYVSGNFASTVDFDAGPGTTNLTSLGGADAFVAKYSSTGDFLWARRMGGAGYDSAGRLSLDGNGHLYVVGQFTAAGDFDGNGTPEITSQGGGDAFVAQLAADSGTTQWVRSFGGTVPSGYSFNDSAGGVAAASDGSVFVSGFVYDTSGQVDINPGAGVAMTDNGAFVLKLDSAGNYLTSWGGIPRRYDAGATKLTVDDSGVYLTSNYVGTVDFDPGPGQAIRQSWYTDSDDIFLAKYSQEGELAWVQTLGGVAQHHNYVAQEIELDADRVDIAGYFVDGMDLNGDRIVDLSATGGGANDLFVASYAKSDGALTWARALGTTGQEQASGLAFDGTGGLLVTGSFSNTLDFDPGPGVSSLTAVSPAGTNPYRTDGFLWKLDGASGTHQSVWMLGPNLVVAHDVEVAAGGLTYLSGSLRGTASFPNGLTRTAIGYSDAFLLKFNTTAPRVTITSPTSNQTLVEGATVSFAGTAVDDQEGNLTSSLTWQSQLTGTLPGTGGSIGPVTLSVGAHLVTAQATDTDGLVGSRGISVLVNPKAPTNLTGTVSGSQVTLRWTDNSGSETAYSIERAVKPSRNATPVWSVVATLAANTVVYVHTPGKGNWLYRVQATAPGVASAYSNQLSVSVTKSGPTTASTSLALTAEPQASTLTANEMTSSTSVPASSIDSTSQPTVPGQLLMPTKTSTKSKLADAALATDESWFDGELKVDLLLDLAAAR